VIVDRIELSVIVPTLDVLSDRVGRLVSSLRATLEDPYEVILIDNGGGPQGFSAPVNAGIRAARGDYVAIVNDDVTVLEGWWRPLRAAAGHHFVVFPETVVGMMRFDFAAWCFVMDRDSIARCEHLPGELLDERMKIWGADNDLMERLEAMGTPPVCITASRITHTQSATIADPEHESWMRAQLDADLETHRAKRA
jgi:GT2 family glycosyltransferase